MKNKAEYRRLPICLVIVLLSATIWLSQANVAVAQTNAAIQNQQIISSLEQFKNDVLSMRSEVSKPLGPYPIYTKCTWCSKTFIFCIEKTTETWDTKVDFTWTRQRLSRVLQQAQQNTSTFSSSYEQTKEWINRLPEFSRRFDSNADIVLAVQKEIKAGVGPNDQQRERAKRALQTLAQDLDTSKSLLQNSTRDIAAFLQQQSSYRGDIRQAIDSADRSAQQALTSLENSSKTHHCQGGLKEKYDGIKADFSRSIREISDDFRALEASSHKAERSLAQLLGTVVSSQTELNSVLRLVNAAGNDQLGSFLQRLHLNAAKKQWSDLANYAVGNLSK